MIKAFLAVAILISTYLATPAPAQDAAAPFDGKLQRLAEILGALHYLRGICGSRRGSYEYEFDGWKHLSMAIEEPGGCRDTGTSRGCLRHDRHVTSFGSMLRIPIR
ncbi:TIGR02301 family protein [Bradyrhizobium sp. CB1650]|uniref:TIGR02301 family protein n=1 Tax=Bradyrhizobium sp. CB1650 TaxID=3039153 RepID=UPI00243577F4|nr:TIGR02301 family protein [Bradyrhizobium sp. CB1650]WGD51400.1 TIGR02301 family protein [Bradyrhizobium sp. CB1650]